MMRALRSKPEPALGLRLLALRRRFGSSDAFVWDEGRLSYEELVNDALNFAASLRQGGLREGGRVAIVLPNSGDYLRAFLGTLLAGCVAVPLDVRSTKSDLEYAFDDASVEVIVAGASEHPAVMEAVLNRASQVSTTIYWAEGCNPSLAPAGVLLMTDAITMARKSATLTATEGRADDLAAIFYSSGTTGRPRGVMHTRAGLMACVDSLSEMYKSFFSAGLASAVSNGVRMIARYRGRLLRAAFKRRVWLTPISFNTIAGNTILLQSLLSGGLLVTQPRFQPTKLLETIERERVTVLPLTPTMAEVILRVADRVNADSSSLLVIGLGGSQAPPDLARRLKNRFRCAVAIGYGSTELGGGILATQLSDDDFRQTETVGRPFPGAEVMVVDDTHRKLPANTVGELACRAHSLMSGYLGDVDATKAVRDEDGWYFTGDLAMIDDRGYVRVVGRKRDLIIRGGQKVFPLEVEAVLESQANVQRAAIIGVPDAVAGERIWGFVVPEAGQSIDKELLRTRCAKDLAAYKVPDAIRVVDALPVTADGKIQKFVLKRQALLESPSVTPSVIDTPPAELGEVQR
jgi:fatty-acyl-CoA synthase